MRGVEVAVREQVTQARDVGLGDLVFGCQEVFWERFDRLADLDETNPDGIKHQAVAEVATLQMRSDRVDRGGDVLESLSVVPAQSLTMSRMTSCRTPSLSETAGTRSTPASRSRSSSPRKATRANRPVSSWRSTSMSMSLSAVS